MESCLLFCADQRADVLAERVENLQCDVARFGNSVLDSRMGDGFVSVSV
ncbi:hypothetical protein ACFL6I_00930 [candidate division KSB1 bacterium]